MATTNWTLATGGNFATDLGWSTKHHPVAGDTANITNELTGPYDVDVTDAEAAGTINLGAVNAQLAISGTLTADTIDVTKGTLAVVGSGEITGGTTIIFDPAAEFRPVDGTLDGVTWQGTLALVGVTQSSLLTITGSLNVLDKAGSGPGEIDITGPGAALNFESSMTLDGTGGN